ncbi:hypothetical protein [Candidatus Methanodesulfokora washburnensis]|uniref:Uncharacterized protein n=1 Tax=Candidatus Methanodesulfokora washburnensis TaxID=2478471 RepID=A0A429GWM4_9CREN|nr:hypothetical protein [Candidatus Methanodesulfokores washburnensis]RSN78356.1 hypothetical protein D6D85_01335 [Candidatus Methanodesulfokores washburnensis]
MQKRIRYKVPKPVLDKAIELFFKDNPQATTTPEVSELYEGGYIREAREYFRDLRRKAQREFIKAKEQEAEHYRQQLELAQLRIEELNKEIEQLKQQIEQLKNSEDKKLAEKLQIELAKRVTELNGVIQEQKSVIEEQQKVIIEQQNEIIAIHKKQRIAKITRTKTILTALGLTVFPVAVIPLSVYGIYKIFEGQNQRVTEKRQIEQVKQVEQNNAPQKVQASLFD